MTYPIPRDAFDDRLAIFGTAGSGKTYLTIGAMARLLAGNSRIIGVDPLGVMYGLRLEVDGKTPSPYSVVIFGGQHGDLPLTEHAGALIGETAATMRESCILDLSELGTKASERRFMLSFLTALYRHANRQPVHLIIDEADMFAPQKLLDKDGDAAKLLGMMETVVRRGRVKGFVPWLISQRPAVLSKDVLSQADGVIALKLTAKQDKDAFEGWIEGAADKATGREILASLPNMNRGQGVVWVPGRAILKTSTFPVNKTFDSSRTPARGEKRASIIMPALDLTKLEARLAKVTEEVRANDPRALKSALAQAQTEIALLRKSAGAAPQVTKGNIPTEQQEQFRIIVADNKALRKILEVVMKFIVEINASNFFGAAGNNIDKAAIEKVIADATERATKLIETNLHGRNKEMETLRRNGERISEQLKKILENDIVVRVDVTHNEAFTVKSQSPQRSPILGKSATPHDGSKGTLPPGERAVLIAAAQFNPVERDQLTILTGYKRSSRDAYIQRLREKGYVSADGSAICITETGIEALPSDYEPLPTGRDLQSYWLGRLPEGEKRILQALIDAYPAHVERSTLDDITGYKRSSRDAYLQRMKAKRLWTGNGSAISASQVLF